MDIETEITLNKCALYVLSLFNYNIDWTLRAL